jgi:hypothetical protein
MPSYITHEPVVEKAALNNTEISVKPWVCKTNLSEGKYVTVGNTFE